MNILFLASSADFHVDLWVKYFTEKNQVYLFSDTQSFLKDQKYENVKVIKSEGLFGHLLNRMKIEYKVFFQLNKFISVRNFASEIEQIIKTYNIEIIHAHSLYFGFLNYFINSSIPKVFTPMGSDVIIHAQKNIIYRYMAKKAFLASDIITNDSIVLQNKGYLLGGRKKENYIIKNGVDINIFYPKKNKLKNKFGLNQKDLLLFSARALEPIYNIDAIIYAIKLLQDKNIKFKCMFAYAFGNEYLHKLKNISKNLNVEDKIIWLGYKKNNEMAALYNASDIVISIPKSDSSPQSVYEAMFCKKPVIVSDLEWAKKYFQKEKNIFKIKKIEPKEICNSILNIVSDTSKSQSITQNAYEIVNKHYNYRTNMSNFEKIMRKKVLEKNTNKI